MRSHSVTCHPAEVNTPRLNHSHAGRYSIYLCRRDWRLSWPSWLDSSPAGSRTSDLSITSPALNQCNHQDSQVIGTRAWYKNSRVIISKYSLWTLILVTESFQWQSNSWLTSCWQNSENFLRNILTATLAVAETNKTNKQTNKLYTVTQKNNRLIICRKFSAIIYTGWAKKVSLIISSGCKFLTVYMCQKLWKLAGSRQSYCKNYRAYFFGPPCIWETAYWR